VSSLRCGGEGLASPLTAATVELDLDRLLFGEGAPEELVSLWFAPRHHEHEPSHCVLPPGFLTGRAFAPTSPV
jgi:hypothetical protein